MTAKSFIWDLISAHSRFEDGLVCFENIIYSIFLLRAWVYDAFVMTRQNFQNKNVTKCGYTKCTDAHLERVVKNSSYTIGESKYYVTIHFFNIIRNTTVVILQPVRVFTGSDLITGSDRIGPDRARFWLFSSFLEHFFYHYVYTVCI